MSLRRQRMHKKIREDERTVPIADRQTHTHTDTLIKIPRSPIWVGGKQV